MTTNLKKIITITTIGTGSLGIGVCTFYLLKNNLSIEEKLKNENKKLLISNSSSLWEIKLNTYKKISKVNAKVKLNKTETKENLKFWCDEKIRFRFNEENKKLYEGLKEICTVPSNKEKLLSDGKELAENAQDWEARKEAYKREENNKTIKDINKDSSDLIDKLKMWCQDKLEQEFLEERDDNYDLLLKWCTKEGQ